VAVIVMVVLVVALEVNVEFGSRNAAFFRPNGVQVIAVELEFSEFVLEPMKIEAKVQQGSKEHIAADAAE
jgi:hypothetical protein